MNTFTVEITGRDMVPCARLLEALTGAGLLSSDIVWEELDNKVILHIKGDGTDKRWFAFEMKRFHTKVEKE